MEISKAPVFSPGLLQETGWNCRSGCTKSMGDLQDPIYWSYLPLIMVNINGYYIYMVNDGSWFNQVGGWPTPPLWKIWKSVGMTIPYMKWKTKHVWNHQPVNTSTAKKSVPVLACSTKFFFQNAYWEGKNHTGSTAWFYLFNMYFAFSDPQKDRLFQVSNACFLLAGKMGFLKWRYP